MEQQCLFDVIDISSLKSPTMHVAVSFSFETMFNSSSVNLNIGVDGGLYTDMVTYTKILPFDVPTCRPTSEPTYCPAVG